MRALFVVNPAAGHGRAASRWSRAGGEDAARRLGAEVRWTERPGHAARLARDGVERGCDAVVAVGGDGTVGEVVDGYLTAAPEARAGAVLGTWPVGSGCDLARHLGVKAESSLAALLESPVRRLDAGRLRGLGYDGRSFERHFLNMASMGLAGEVALRAHRGGKPLGGTFSYMASSLAALLRARARPLELTVDGVREEGRYHLLCVANTSTVGGGMRIAPGADPEDGFMELVSIEDLPRLELLRHFPKIYSGTHLGIRGVSLRRIRRLAVRSAQTVHLNVDGDVAGTLPVELEVLPGAVPFLYSRRAS